MVSSYNSVRVYITAHNLTTLGNKTDVAAIQNGTIDGAGQHDFHKHYGSKSLSFQTINLKGLLYLNIIKAAFYYI